LEEHVPLSEQQRVAAIFVAEDRKTDESIAKLVGVTRRTIANWKNDPEFVEAVDGERKAIIVLARTRFVATKEGRLKLKIDRHRCLMLSIEDGINSRDPRGQVTLCRELSRLEAEIASELEPPLPKAEMNSAGLIREIHAMEFVSIMKRLDGLGSHAESTRIEHELTAAETKLDAQIHTENCEIL
jgi:hypothetical protein